MGPGGGGLVGSRRRHPTCNISSRVQGYKKYGNKIRNNEEFVVLDFDTSNVKMKSVITDEVILVKHDELKFCQMAYYITVHCSQGDTVSEPYSIYEWQRFDETLMYVAISRATMKSQVNFCDVYHELSTGMIYKITNELTNKIYFGSTKTSIEQIYQDSKNILKHLTHHHYI